MKAEKMKFNDRRAKQSSLKEFKSLHRTYYDKARSAPLLSQRFKAYMGVEKKLREIVKLIEGMESL